jgi:hypothetical protein
VLTACVWVLRRNQLAVFECEESQLENGRGGDGGLHEVGQILFRVFRSHLTLRRVAAGNKGEQRVRERERENMREAGERCKLVCNQQSD